MKDLLRIPLIQPTFIWASVEVSPLAKKNADDPRFTNNDSLSLGAICQCLYRIERSIDQLSRLKHRPKPGLGDDEATGIDYDYVEALEYGIPQLAASGGIDRLIMLLTDVTSIRDVLLFPTMK